jgi:hypothetical protein
VHTGPAAADDSRYAPERIGLLRIAPRLDREHSLYILKGGASRRRWLGRCLRPAGPSGLRPTGWWPAAGGVEPVVATLLA